ncbi:hypothetical protein BCR34DRAFT_658168, partial [Clohesyomyces aquaticus]
YLLFPIRSRSSTTPPPWSACPLLLPPASQLNPTKKPRLAGQKSTKFPPPNSPRTNNMRFCLVLAALLAVLVVSVPAKEAPESAGLVDDPDHREIGIAVASSKGVFTGNHTDIYDEYWRALNWLCPYEHEQSCHLNSLDKDGFLRGNQWVYMVNDIVDPRAHTSHVKVWVERGLYASDQIRRLMIGSIAGTIQAWHSLKGNCIKGDEGWGDHGCAIPSYIGLRLEDTVNVMDVHFQHSSTTQIMESHCEEAIPRMNKKLDELMPEWNKAMSVTKKNIHCWDP